MRGECGTEIRGQRSGNTRVPLDKVEGFGKHKNFVRCARTAQTADEPHHFGGVCSWWCVSEASIKSLSEGQVELDRGGIHFRGRRDGRNRLCSKARLQMCRKWRNFNGLNRLRNNSKCNRSFASLFLQSELVCDRGMHGDDERQVPMFRYLTLVQRIPADHPVSQIYVLVDRALERCHIPIEALTDTSGSAPGSWRKRLPGTKLPAKNAAKQPEKAKYPIAGERKTGIETFSAVCKAPDACPLQAFAHFSISQ